MNHLLVSVGPNDTGLEVARTLKMGLPSLSLTAVSRAPHGPALHADVFDDVWPVPAWDALDKNDHASNLTNKVQSDKGFVPTIPAETHVLSDARPNFSPLLAPSPTALSKTVGPTPDAAEELPVSVPAWISLSAPVEDLHAFGRRHGWSLWLRSPLGQRTVLGHWSDFDEARDEMSARGGDLDRLFLQRQVPGTPRFLSFVADTGTLLDAALLHPVPDRRVTVEARPLSSDVRTALCEVVETLGWTGGGRLDLVVDDTGTRWLDTWRPCFGAEVTGLARCGVNLPAQLAAARTDRTLPTPDHSASVFAFDLSVPAPDEREFISPPSLPAATRPDLSSPVPALSDALRSVVADLPPAWATGNTPRPVLLPTRTQNRFEAFTEAADRIESALELDAARIGLSIKTNPSDRLLKTARETGMLAETIHPDEMEHARRHGYDTGEIIVNGPVQALLPTLDTAPYALFGDAIADLADLPFDPSGAIVGVRTRPPERGPSRFGVDLSESKRMDRLCDRLCELPDDTRIGLHLHAPSSTLGHERWWASLSRVLSWAQTIQDRTGRSVQCLDLGGGWHPDDWLDVFVPGLHDRRGPILNALPDLNTLLLEPGKALSQPLGVVVSRVLDARPSRSEAILDASLAELSNIDYHPHRLLAHTDEHGWHRLPRGEGRLLGRLCMEADVLGRRRRVDHLSPGDTVVVCDAGAYDASMTYPFGRGTASSF